MKLFNIFVACTAFTSVNLAATELCFLANDGFLIKGKEQSVVIDALITKPMYGYPALSPSANSAFINGKAPFENVNLALTTHNHQDHFQADVLLEHAKLNNTHYVLPLQAKTGIDEINDKHNLHKRLTIVKPKPDTNPVTKEINGVNISIFSINHGARDIQGTKQKELNHSVYQVEVDGINFVHLGDAMTSQELFAQAGAHNTNVDYLLVPYFSLSDPVFVNAMNKAWDYKNLVIMHLEAIDRNIPKQVTWLEKKVSNLQERFPQAWIPTKEMECLKVETSN